METAAKGGPYYADYLQPQKYVEDQNPKNIIKKLMRQRDKLTEK